MSIIKFLHDHTSRETAYEVKDYPYGRKLRCQMYYWIESVPGKGDRVRHVSIDPRTGRENNPHKSVYSTFTYLYLNEEGHVLNGVIRFYDMKDVPDQFEFLFNQIGIEHISKGQQEHIRSTFVAFFIEDTYYEYGQYPAAAQPAYEKWSTDMVTYMMNCPFSDILKFPAEKPPRDASGNQTEAA